MVINYQNDDCVIVSVTKEELDEIARRIYVGRFHTPGKVVLTTVDKVLSDWEFRRESEYCHFHGERVPRAGEVSKETKEILDKIQATEETIEFHSREIEKCKQAVEELKERIDENE